MFINTCSINNLSKKKSNLSDNMKTLNLSEEKKDNKSVQTINCLNNKSMKIQISPIKKTNHKMNAMRKKVSNNNLVKTITNSTNKLNIKNNKNNINNNIEDSYTKIFLKKAKSKERKKKNPSKSKKSSLKILKAMKTEKIDLSNINYKSLKNSFKIDLNRNSYKKLKINEIPIFKTLNNSAALQNPLKNINKKSINTNNNIITNSSKQKKPKRKTIRMILMDNSYKQRK
jgi:hypothetical protein